MEKLKELNEIKHDLIDAVKAELAHGVQNVNTSEMGEVIDMIKDLASAEKDCMEACYYEAVTEAMEEYDEGDSKRMGYDRWRYASGRFAPKGRGTYGYLPSPMRMEEPWTSDNMGMRTPANGDRNADRYGYHASIDSDKPSERLDEAVEVMGEVWGMADGELRKRMKATVKDLLHQMEQAG